MELADYGIWGALFATLGYFASRWMQKIEKDLENTKKDVDKNKQELSERTDTGISEAIEKFSEVAESLQDAISGMNKNINSMEKVIGILQAQVEIRDKNTEKQISDFFNLSDRHENKIQDHEKRIGKIESNCEFRYERKQRQRSGD